MKDSASLGAEFCEISTPFLFLYKQVNQIFIFVTKKPNPFQKRTDPVLLVCLLLFQYRQAVQQLSIFSVR